MDSAQTFATLLAAWPIERRPDPDLPEAQEALRLAGPEQLAEWLLSPHALMAAARSESLAVIIRTGRHPILHAAGEVSRDFPSSSLSGIPLRSISVSSGSSLDASRRAVFDLESSLSEFCHRTGIPQHHPGFRALSFILYPFARSSLSYFDASRSSIEVFGRGGDVAASLFRYFLSLRPSSEINQMCDQWLQHALKTPAAPVLRKKEFLAQSAAHLKNLATSAENDEDLESRLFRRHRLFVKWRDDLYRGASPEAARASWNRWRTGNRIALSAWRDTRHPVVMAWSKEERLIDTLVFRRAEWPGPAWVLRTNPDFSSMDFLSRPEREALLAAAAAQALRMQAGRDGWLASSSSNAPHGREAEEFAGTFFALCDAVGRLD